jgi:hypothetical protein
MVRKSVLVGIGLVYMIMLFNERTATQAKVAVKHLNQQVLDENDSQGNDSL